MPGTQTACMQHGAPQLARPAALQVLHPFTSNPTALCTHVQPDNPHTSRRQGLPGSQGLPRRRWSPLALDPRGPCWGAATVTHCSPTPPCSSTSHCHAGPGTNILVFKARPVPRRRLRARRGQGAGTSSGGWLGRADRSVTCWGREGGHSLGSARLRTCRAPSSLPPFLPHSMGQTTGWYSTCTHASMRPAAAGAVHVHVADGRLALAHRDLCTAGWLARRQHPARSSHAAGGRFGGSSPCTADGKQPPAIALCLHVWACTAL